MFNEDKFAFVPKAVDKELCDMYTERLKKLTSENPTYDNQVPAAPAIYGAFDDLLEKLIPFVEQQTDLTLYPAYSYARLYGPGDELKPHYDRGSCEISMTLCIGYEGSPWPIHFSKLPNKQQYLGSAALEVGSALIYKGMEIIHWREPYTEGSWQAQIFLHYVDANGRFQHLKYDRRNKLNIDGV